MLLLALLLAAGTPTFNTVRVVSSDGILAASVTAAGASGANALAVQGVTGGVAFSVNCVSGCSAAGAFTDNTAFTAGTTTETNIGGVFNDGLAGVTSGNAAAARITASRALHVNLRNNTGTEIGTSSNPVSDDLRTVVGTTVLTGNGTTGAGSPRVTIASDNTAFSVNAIQSGTWTVAQGSPPWTSNITQFGGSNVSTGTGAGGAGIPRVTVSNDSNVLATQSGTWNIGTVTAVTSITNTVTIQGDVASGSANSGNPLQDGARAATTIPTAVSDGQRVGAMADKFGRYQVGRIDRGLVSKSGVITLSSTTETTLLTAVAATFLDVFYLHCINTSTTATRVDIRDATGGTIRDNLACPAAVGDCSGLVSDLIPLPQTAVNNNWTVQLSGAVTDVRCVAYAEQSK